MRQISAFLVSLVLAGCQSLVSDDPASYQFRMPSGSHLELNRPLQIPAGRSHVTLQGGTVVSSADSYDVSCRFEVRQLGPRTIEADSFLITAYSSQQEWENYPNTKRYYKTIRFRSDHQADILPMVCEYLSYPLQGRPVTLVQIEAALGDYFTFRLGEQGP